ncbi:hypothetical protein PanWU01x14_227360 [Parasponia andersonii]|uniref:Uncharacterized protein n=1 Tax=Parasponia andersonii TaxID=3476 RepID=A0A2P5BM11_PARAD|nr:hypothetical protein PanWU01x14_227360 [Parasponia andersonii]
MARFELIKFRIDQDLPVRQCDSATTTEVADRQECNRGHIVEDPNMAKTRRPLAGKEPMEGVGLIADLADLKARELYTMNLI